MPGGQGISGILREGGGGRRRAVHVHSATPNESGVSGICTARGEGGGAKGSVPLTYCNTERDGVSGVCIAKGGGGGGAVYLHTATPKVPEVSGVARQCYGCKRSRPLTLCNAEWAEC